MDSLLNTRALKHQLLATQQERAGVLRALLAEAEALQHAAAARQQERAAAAAAAAAAAVEAEAAEAAQLWQQHGEQEWQEGEEGAHAPRWMDLMPVAAQQPGAPDPAGAGAAAWQGGQEQEQAGWAPAFLDEQSALGGGAAAGLVGPAVVAGAAALSAPAFGALPGALRAPPGALPLGRQLRLVAGGASIPHPDKAHTGGEDAFLVCGRGLGAAAVADGVGGWAELGIDPAEYPRWVWEDNGRE